MIVINKKTLKTHEIDRVCHLKTGPMYISKCGLVMSRLSNVHVEDQEITCKSCVKNKRSNRPISQEDQSRFNDLYKNKDKS